MFTAPRRTLTALSAAAVMAAATLAPAAAQAKPAPTHAKPAKTTAKQKAAIRKLRRQFQATAPAGTIMHFKAEHQVAGQGAWAIEGWVEQGGAERYRYVQEPPASAVTAESPGIRQTVWGRDGYWAVTDVMRTPSGGERQVTNVGYSDPAHSYDSFVYALQHVDDAQAAFDGAPGGPAIDGSPTRAAAIALPQTDPTVEQSMTALLDAASRQPRRITFHVSFPGMPNAIDDTYDVSLWQTLPRTADASLLGGTIPLTASIQTTGR